jgi:hypothetical protein
VVVETPTTDKEPPVPEPESGAEKPEKPKAEKLKIAKNTLAPLLLLLLQKNQNPQD